MTRKLKEPIETDFKGLSSYSDRFFEQLSSASSEIAIEDAKRAHTDLAVWSNGEIKLSNPEHPEVEIGSEAESVAQAFSEEDQKLYA